MTQTDSNQKYLSTRKVLGLPEDGTDKALLVSLVEKIVGIDKLNRIMEDVGRPWPDANPLIKTLFERLNINWTVENPEILEKLDDRPKVFVANHPYGLPDAFAMFQLLTKYRPDIRIFANKLLAATRLEEDRLLFVDPFAANESRGQNRKSIAAAIRHLRGGGDLALFPGRICSHLKTSDWTISDSEWTDQIRKFVEVSGGDMVPLYISGRNSILFNLSGLIHPRIRTYMLLREFLRGGHDFRFTVGEPISAENLARISKSVPTGTFSRSLTYAMKTGVSKLPDIPQLIQPGHLDAAEIKRLSRIPVDTGGAGVKTLLEQNEILYQQGGFTVFRTGAGASESLLDIICETRLQAYASATSITEPSELRDRFDDFYHHLILWDDKQQTVAGVYRYTFPVAQNPVSPETLVTNSIFDLKPDFIRLLPNSIELGRAAIIPEYQKSYSPLMLLWRALMEIPARDKSIKYAFGPVTMGSAYNPVSRELLRRFIMKNWSNREMEGFVSAKRPLDLEIPREVNLSRLEGACNSFSNLGNVVNGFEGGKRSLPVLFRHYANAGSKYIGFGEWKELDRSTAGLTVLEIGKMNKSLVTRYFGAEGAEAFLAGR